MLYVGNWVRTKDKHRKRRIGYIEELPNWDKTKARVRFSDVERIEIVDLHSIELYEETLPEIKDEMIDKALESRQFDWIAKEWLND